MSLKKTVRSTLFDQAMKRFQAGDFHAAVILLRRILPQGKNDARILRMLGVAEVQTGAVEIGRERIERALKLNPIDGESYVELAMSYSAEARFDDAMRIIERGLGVRTRDQSLLAAKAQVHARLGEHDKAYDIVSALLDAGNRHPAVVRIFAGVCARYGRQEEGVALLEEIVDNPRLSPGAKMEALFLLGDLFDGLHRYDEAFDAYRRANSMKFAPFDPAAHAASVTQLIDAWPRSVVESLPKSTVDSRLPVYIVGMPRSGTTLVEQILASHPAVGAGGERHDLAHIVGWLQRHVDPNAEKLHRVDTLRTPGVLDECASALVEALSHVKPGAERVTDKMPQNFHHLGLLNQMLPGARVIHCVRNPLDTCLSCYFQLFGGDLPFSYSLDHLGAYHKDYRRIMSHWKQVLDIPILDVAYEDLVSDQERVTRRIIDFVGLPWDDRCLRFHETQRIANTASIDQVRRPIYRSSVARHEKYEKHIAPLREAADLG